MVVSAGRLAAESLRVIPRKRLSRMMGRLADLDGPPELRGGVKGSFPVDGDYGRYQLLNWAAKFAIDANILELDRQPSGD